MFETSEGPVRALLVAVQLPDADDIAFRSSVTELGRLARTLGVEVAGELTQRRAALHPGTVVGKGKLAELRRMVGAVTADDAASDDEDDAGEDPRSDEARDAGGDGADEREAAGPGDDGRGVRGHGAGGSVEPGSAFATGDLAGEGALPGGV